MSRLIWSPSALRDVQRLHRFLASKGGKSASRAIKTIRSNVKILAHQPEVGRPVDGMEPEFREWLIDFGSSDYVALYRTDGELTTVLVQLSSDIHTPLVPTQQRVSQNPGSPPVISGLTPVIPAKAGIHTDSSPEPYCPVPPWPFHPREGRDPLLALDSRLRGNDDHRVSERVGCMDIKAWLH